MIRDLTLRLAAALLCAAPLLAPMSAGADTVLITGADSGIGLEFARQYAAHGWTVIATHRRAQPPKTLTDLATKYPQVRIETLDVTNLAVNIKGPLIVSETFYKNVLASGQKKIIAVSSSNGTLTGEAHPRRGAMFYRMSKSALNREMQIVAAETQKDGVTVVMFNPGPTLTEHQAYLAGKYEGMLKTSFTVENMIHTIGKVTIADTGKFLRYDGVTEPW
jgi:NAD(P)-dependent dehydrogenase (short-subunit alcohol dehydrogenase family)